MNTYHGKVLIHHKQNKECMKQRTGK